MKYVLVFCILFLYSCSSKVKELAITPIIDRYAEQNNNKKDPVEGYFLIQNFQNNKLGIENVVNFVRDSLSKTLPFNRNTSNVVLLKRNNEVFFEDGYAILRSKNYFSFGLSESYPRLFKNMIFTPSVYCLSRGELNKINTIQKHNCHIKKYSDIQYVYIEYDSFNIDIFQTFLNNIYYDRYIERSKNKFYKLINIKTQKQECIINYINSEVYDIVFID